MCVGTVRNLVRLELDAGVLESTKCWKIPLGESSFSSSWSLNSAQKTSGKPTLPFHAPCWRLKSNATTFAACIVFFILQIDSLLLSKTQILVGSAGVKEEADPWGANTRAGDLGGVFGSWSPQCHQRWLEELRQNHTEHQRPWTIRFWRCTGEDYVFLAAFKKIMKTSHINMCNCVSPRNTSISWWRVTLTVVSLDPVPTRNFCRLRKR